jgi:hypothetical protein
MTTLTIDLKLKEIIDGLDNKDYESFKKEILKLSNNLSINTDKNSDLVIISNNFTKNNINNSDIEKECRSIIVNKKDLSIVCYTHDNIYYNEEAKNFLLNKDITKTRKIYECYEGTLLTIYNFEDEWNMSTRKCIRADKSFWSSNKTHYNMFVETIGKEFSNFTKLLNKENYYMFVLVHHENKNIVDYSYRFENKEYKKVVHVMTRNSITHKEVNDEETYVKLIKDFGVVLPTEYEDFTLLDEENNTETIKLPLKFGGLIIKNYNNETNKTDILKFESNSYQMLSVLQPNTNNIYKSFVELYQNDMLKKHLEYFPGNAKMKNPIFDEVPYDTIGIVDATFKVLTSELFELFKLLWDVKDCSHKNKDLYKLLPHEYTTVLYKIRGIYYTKKEKYINRKNTKDTNDTKDNSISNNSTYNLRIFDIYSLLKNYDTRNLLKLIYSRKLLKNKIDNKEEEIYEQLRKISLKCDRISLKMIAILTNNMYPDEDNINVPVKTINTKNVI